LIKDYDLTIQYHPSKSNVVADALSRTGVPKTVIPLIADLDRMGISFCYVGTAHEQTQLLIQSPILDRLLEAQQHDHLIQEVHKRIANGNPESSASMSMMYFVLEDDCVCHKSQM